MQLARVDPGLAQPHALHQLDHGARTLTLAFALLQLLVVGVAANAPIAASPRHAWTAASAIARSMRMAVKCALDGVASAAPALVEHVLAVT